MQLSLLELPGVMPTADTLKLVRNTDPITSKIAAARSIEFSGNHRETILTCLKTFGAQTADEIAKRTPLNSVQINRRFIELHRAGQIHPTGDLRLSASGRPERVWKAN